MKKTYYLFNPGRMSRKDHTLKFVPVSESGLAGKPKYLPIESVSALYVFGSLDANSALYNFLGRQQIPVHFFDYYEHYTGSFQPKEYLLAGKMQVAQTKTYLQTKRRLHLAQQLIFGASFNMLKNVRYYSNRKKDMTSIIKQLEMLRGRILETSAIQELMGIEGNCRQVYYRSFENIIDGFEMNNRSKQPPSNEVNALVSFGNMMCYTLVLDQIYHTQLNPTISFLHEPGTRRFSLALDLAEVFKPTLIDRTIFRLLNKRELKVHHFERKMNGCFLKDSGRKIFIKVLEERLRETIQHPNLGRKVSYKHLVKLECYKIAKYVLKMAPNYLPYKMK